MGIPVTIVVITRNRCAELLRTLDRLCSLPGRPPVIVVDNQSQDGTVAAVRRLCPEVSVIGLPQNRGAVARNAGVRLARTPYVAFADDDSWWAPGALEQAVDAFERWPRLALVAGRVVVEPGGTLDRASRKMACAPLGREPDLPGPSILGHLACASVVRRSAFLACGGYSRLLVFGGEEQLLALDLRARGLGLCYLDGVVAHHQPSPARPAPGRRWALHRRNDVLVCWMRRPLPVALRATLGLAADAAREPQAARALAQLVVRPPAALRQRRRVPPGVEAQIRRLERARLPVPAGAT